jgi:N4-gp56 family major capsid protein
MVKYTDAGISPRTQTYAALQMLRHAGPVMVLDKLGETKPMPMNKGLEMKFRRPIPFTASTTPLVEGVTPDGTTFAYEDVTVSLQQYGDWSNFTDVIEDTHEDPVINSMAEMHGENIGRTMEALNYGVVKGGTSVTYATGTARNATAHAISLTKQRAIIRSMKAQKAQKITSILSSSVNYGTRSVHGAYIAVGHTDLESDIRSMPGFKDVADYGTRSTVSDYEIGSVEDVRYILSPDLAPFLGAGAAVGSTGMVAADDTNIDVYPILIFGKYAWATVPMRGGGSISPTVISAGKKTKDDPLGQRGVMAWKGWHAAVILNDDWMMRYEVAVSAL